MKQFGTILWAAELAKKMQQRAIEKISKNKRGVTYMRGLAQSTKFYIALLTNCEYKRFEHYNSGPAFKRGYLVMSEKEFDYACGRITHEQLQSIPSKKRGRKYIVAADVSVYGKLQLVPIR